MLLQHLYEALVVDYVINGDWLTQKGSPRAGLAYCLIA
jgi:hypothetical protein